MTDEREGPVPGRRAATRDGDERRRRLVLWVWFSAVVLVLLYLFVMCTGGGDEDEAVPPTASTTTAPPATGNVPLPPAETLPPATPAPTPPATTATLATPPPTEAADTTTTTEPGPIDVSGTWVFSIDVTVATGACASEEDESVDPDTVTIEQDGDVLVVVGLNGEDPPWAGRIVGDVVTFAGERDEDAGRTIASFILTVDTEGTQMSGIEEWTWSGPGGSCPDSRSEVTAERP